MTKRKIDIVSRLFYKYSGPLVVVWFTVQAIYATSYFQQIISYGMILLGIFICITDMRINKIKRETIRMKNRKDDQ